MDIITPEQRSRNMSAIRSSDTKPEVYLRKLLFAKGYRYSLNSPNVPGHPDLFLRKYNTALFVHGCFWHRHEGCRYTYNPKSRIEFWQQKFESNIRRDNIVKDELRSMGIRQLIVWECAIKCSQKKGYSSEQLVSLITDFICSNRTYAEISDETLVREKQEWDG